MPNFVKNKIIVGRSEYGRRLIDKYVSFNKERKVEEFDFNKVIEMPDDLKIEFSSKSDKALCLYLTKMNPDVTYYGDMDEKMDKTNYSSLIRRLSKRLMMSHDFTLRKDQVDELLNKYKEDDLLKLGERQIKNLERYDAINWYEWSINNWGTKWNASDYEVSDDKRNITFETAWDPAIEVMLEISRQNPDIKFAFLYSDEEIGAHTGYLLTQNGRIDCKGTFEDYSPDAYKLAFDLWDCGDEYEYDDKIGTYVPKEEYESRLEMI